MIVQFEDVLAWQWQKLGLSASISELANHINYRLVPLYLPTLKNEIVLLIIHYEIKVLILNGYVTNRTDL